MYVEVYYIYIEMLYNSLFSRILKHLDKYIEHQHL